jgi:hypothetical protein
MEIKTTAQGESILSFSEEEIKIINNKKKLILPPEIASTFFKVFLSVFATMDKQVSEYIEKQKNEK